MSFIVHHEGTFYQKDLGKQTRMVVSAMSTYNPGKSWVLVEKVNLPLESGHE